MAREMKRIRQLMSEEDNIKVLDRNTNGVLSLAGDEGYPYPVPLSYAYADGKIYFHGRPEGYKVDAVKQSEKAAFCVVDTDEVDGPAYSTCYRSVIAYGKPRIVTDAEEKFHALQVIGRKYNPAGTEEYLKNFIEKELDMVGVIALDIDFMTGKEAIEFVRAKEGHK